MQPLHRKHKLHFFLSELPHSASATFTHPSLACHFDIRIPASAMHKRVLTVSRFENCPRLLTVHVTWVLDPCD